MKYLLTFSSILFTKVLFACNCAFLGELSKTDIDKSDYIALVRIKEILPVIIDSPKYNQSDSYFKIVVEEVFHYKGPSFSEIIVAGGHPKFKRWTSCDFDMDENQEWIIFAKFDRGKPFLYPCGRTALYRQADGFRDWQYHLGIKEVLFLDKFFHKNLRNNTITKGEIRYFFPNGMLEKVENYKKEKLHGEIKYFFPDGKLNGEGFYRKGLLDKTFYWYYPDGAIKSKSSYHKGLNIDTLINYIKIRNSYYPSFVSIYNKRGKIILFQEYSGSLQKRFLHRESVYYPKYNKEKITFYYENGKINSIQYKLNNKDFGDYIEYDKQGKIKRQWKYDDYGRAIKE